MKRPTQLSSAAADPASRTVDGRSRRWERHREARRRELLRVARRLIHRQGPDVTMEDIASASRTSKSIVYRYFSDKAELTQAIGDHILSRMHARLEEVAREGDVDERVEAMVRTYLETAASSPNVYWFIIQPSPGLNHFLESVAGLVAGILPPEVPRATAEAWARGAVGFVRAAAQWSLTHDDPERALDDDITLITTSLLNGAPR